MVVKTVSTSYLVDRICRAEGVKLLEVPVGFKHINDVLFREKVIFGGEESGGYGIIHFCPKGMDSFLDSPFWSFYTPRERAFPK